jgi:hypothetical protein
MNPNITHTISFTYSGHVRVVRNAIPKVTALGYVLWVGLEESRGGNETNVVKSYRDDAIDGPVTVLETRVLALSEGPWT